MLRDLPCAAAGPLVQLEIWSLVPTEAEAIILQSDDKSFDAAL